LPNRVTAMRKFVSVLFIIFTATSVYSQRLFKRNVIYAEAFGNAIGLLSLHYERQLTSKPGLGFHVGAGYLSDDKFRLSIPVGINYLVTLRGYKTFVDLGAGATYSHYEEEPLNGPVIDDNIVSFVPSIGYRQHIVKDKLMWRINISAIFNKYRSFPFAGLSAGFRF
jgi:hypothetical protein